MRVTEQWREAIKAGELPKVQKVVIPEIKAPEGDSRTASFVISNSNEDRDGDVIEVDGWELDAFKSNPVVLWAHDATQLPVAKATAIGVKDGNLVADVEFPSAGVSPFADQVFEFVKGGFLRGASVGFQPTEAEPRKDGDGIHFKRQELFEFSILPIPAHREALAQAKDAGLDVGPMLKWAEQLLEKAQDSGLWVPRFSMEKAIKAVPIEISVSVKEAAPAEPPSGGDPAGGHASAGAGSDQASTKGGQDPDVDKAPDDEPTEPETVSQIMARVEAEREQMENQWDLEMALAESLRSIENSELSDDEKRNLIRQSAQEFVDAMVSNAIGELGDETDPDPDESDDEDMEELAKEVFPEGDPEDDDDTKTSGSAEVDEAFEAMRDPITASLGLDPEERASALKDILEGFAAVVMAAAKADEDDDEMNPDPDPDPDPDEDPLEAAAKAVLAEGATEEQLRDIVGSAVAAGLESSRPKVPGRLPD